jgi:uncharacterized protein with von Willebrand factor type A (vWA) domain
MTYPFSTLPENLAAFCAMLRRDHQFNIGPRELMDAARGLEVTDIADERAVRDALRPILAKTNENAGSFDAAFARFFLGAASPALPGREALSTSTPDILPGQDSGPTFDPRPSMSRSADVEAAAADTVGGAVRHAADSDENATATVLRAKYSPLEAEGTPLVFDPPDREWIEAAARLVARVHAGASRRWRPALRGPRFDFRRTLRTSLHTGGDPVTWRWRAHPRRQPRFVLLIDGSRSMGAFADPALRVAVALSAVSANTETFTFSTMLRRVTRDARRAAAGERRTLHVQQAWGGGTTIGACLDEFLLHFSERLLGPGTVIIIASDGLDVGRPDLLREAMAGLARRSAAVVWLNPLLDTPDYEPTAVGMSVARPYVSVLTSVRDPASLGSLARMLRVRRA